MALYRFGACLLSVGVPVGIYIKNDHKYVHAKFFTQNKKEVALKMWDHTYPHYQIWIKNKEMSTADFHERVLFQIKHPLVNYVRQYILSHKKEPKYYYNTSAHMFLYHRKVYDLIIPHIREDF